MCVLNLWTGQDSASKGLRQIVETQNDIKQSNQGKSKKDLRTKSSLVSCHKIIVFLQYQFPLPQSLAIHLAKLGGCVLCFLTHVQFCLFK